MKTFKFHQDVKCTVWVRQFFTIEAKSLDDAKKQALKFKDSDVSEYDELESTETLYDTETPLTLEENDGQSTIELWYKNDNKPFASNGSDDYKIQIQQFDEFLDSHQIAHRDMTGYTVEGHYIAPEGIYQAYHKDNKLIVILLADNKTAKCFTFHSNWDDLVNNNESFQQQMMDYLMKKYPHCQNLQNEIHDWLNGYLTEIKSTNEVVNDAVPFTLKDLVEGAASFASIYDIQPAKLCGYQIVGENELPEGLYSFQIIRDRKRAVEILSQARDESPEENYQIYPVYEGDIEGPAFI